MNLKVKKWSTTMLLIQHFHLRTSYYLISPPNSVLIRKAEGAAEPSSALVDPSLSCSVDSLFMLSIE